MSMSGIPFQFHKGTIKTKFLVGVVLALLKFQFHKGTIKTVAEDGLEPSTSISIP